MRLSIHQLLFLFAGIVFCGQVLAGPLFVCEEMREGSAVPSWAGNGQQLVYDIGQATHSQQDDRPAEAGHECQPGPCGLCLATTPFVVLPLHVLSAVPSTSFQPDYVPGRPMSHTDILFRPPIVA